jgi:hypothetical protein
MSPGSSSSSCQTKYRIRLAAKFPGELSVPDLYRHSDSPRRAAIRPFLNFSFGLHAPSPQERDVVTLPLELDVFSPGKGSNSPGWA